MQISRYRSSSLSTNGSSSIRSLANTLYCDIRFARRSAAKPCSQTAHTAAETGSIPFDRYKQEDELVDKVNITMERVRPENLARLEAYYRAITAKGVRVYVSCACINVDVIPEGQRGTVRQVSNAFSQAVNAMDGVTMISDQMDYLYRNEDFYDTNYHLLSQAARRNTENWLQDLKTRMVADGLWKEAGQ